MSNTNIPNQNAEAQIDPVYVEALRQMILIGEATIAKIQIKCSIGFHKAANIFEWMEEKGYIEPFSGTPKPRKVLITKEQFETLYGPF